MAEVKIFLALLHAHGPAVAVGVAAVAILLGVPAIIALWNRSIKAEDALLLYLQESTKAHLADAEAKHAIAQQLERLELTFLLRSGGKQ